MEFKFVELSTSKSVEQSASSKNIDTVLSVGCEFSSYKDVQDVLDRRKISLGEIWTIAAGSRTVSSVNKTIDNPQLHFPEQLKYSILIMQCNLAGERCASKKPVKFNRK